MSKITVYRFQKYAITTDKMVVSSRWATLPAIDFAGATPLKNTKKVVDDYEVGPDGFHPPLSPAAS